MTSDLKQLLQTVATQGADRVGFDEPGLIPQIRRRRRRRSAITGVTALATAAVAAVGAYAALPNAGNEITTVSGPDSRPVAVDPPVPPYKCGVTFPAPSTVGTAELTMTQKSMARSSAGWTGAVRTRYTNSGQLPHPLVGGLPPRQFAVVQNNKMVGHAALTVTDKPMTLQPGQSHASISRIDIRACDPGSRLPIGSFLLYEDLPTGSKPAGGQAVVATAPIAQIQLK